MATASQALQNYAETFGRIVKSGGQQEPSWLQSLRQDGFERFSEAGFPTTRDEDWRFTNIYAIAQTNFHLSRNGHRLPYTTANRALSDRGSRLPVGFRGWPLCSRAFLAGTLAQRRTRRESRRVARERSAAVEPYLGRLSEYAARRLRRAQHCVS